MEKNIHQKKLKKTDRNLIETNRFKKSIKDFRLNFPLTLLAIPGIIWVFIFCYIPLPGIILAFKKLNFQDGIFDSPFVGLENFKFLFFTDAAWRLTRNTILLNLVFIITGMFVSIVIALLLFEVRNKVAIKVYQSVIIFPNFLSWVVVGYMSYGILSAQYGLLNVIIKQFGGTVIDWYSNPKYWPAILAFFSIWKGAGIGSVIYYAALVGINREYYEAATIDGASKWMMTKSISLPFLYPLIALFFILNMGNIIRADFGMFYYLTRDVPLLYSTTDVIDTYIFRVMRKIGDPGMAAAAGLYQSVVGFILIMLSNYIVKKVEPDNSLF